MNVKFIRCSTLENSCKDSKLELKIKCCDRCKYQEEPNIIHIPELNNKLIITYPNIGTYLVKLSMPYEPIQEKNMILCNKCYNSLKRFHEIYEIECF